MVNAQEFQAIGLLFLLMVAGFVMTFNFLPEQAGLGLHRIASIQSGFFIILARFIVGPALIALGGYIIVNIIRS